MKATDFFERLWQDYADIAPQARIIERALTETGETIVNDHVAFRTFNQSPINIESLEPLILNLGYQPLEPYTFPVKQLDAIGYVHTDTNLPRIFLSELRVESLSDESQAIIQSLISQISGDITQKHDLFWQGPLWQIPTFSQYQQLAAESEYAAWLSAMGFRANHFTISINALKSMTEVAQMNDFVETLGFEINQSGGAVKGSPDVLLEQSSTLASNIEVEFACGERHSIPSCYYEFAKRYTDDSGQLYQGFVAASADRIFESTDRQNSV